MSKSAMARNAAMGLLNGFTRIGQREIRRHFRLGSTLNVLLRVYYLKTVLIIRCNIFSITSLKQNRAP